jgi:transposase
MIEAVIGAPPSRFGYAHTCWTASLIARHIKKETGTAPSTRTVRRALRELGYRYKRPRYTLARRARSWRQSKGGFSGG